MGWKEAFDKYAPEKRKCAYCASEPEPGWIETENNGPIVNCPVCNTGPNKTPRKGTISVRDYRRGRSA